MVYENIEYRHFKQHGSIGMHERLDEVADIIIETLCSTKDTINIAGDDYPARLVKDKKLRITSSHIEYVFDCLNKNTTYMWSFSKAKMPMPSPMPLSLSAWIVQAVIFYCLFKVIYFLLDHYT